MMKKIIFLFVLLSLLTFSYSFNYSSNINTVNTTKKVTKKVLNINTLILLGKYIKKNQKIQNFIKKRIKQIKITKKAIDVPLIIDIYNQNIKEKYNLKIKNNLSDELNTFLIKYLQKNKKIRLFLWNKNIKKFFIFYHNNYLCKNFNNFNAINYTIPIFLIYNNKNRNLL
jgi:hypothetical protein